MKSEQGLINSVEILDAFAKALSHAGMTPRDISPILGLHLSSLYRILAGRTATTNHTLRTLQMATVFLRWAAKPDTLRDSPLALYLQWVER